MDEPASTSTVPQKIVDELSKKKKPTGKRNQQKK